MKKYKFSVTKAVHQANSTRAKFLACWKRFTSAGKRTNTEKFRSTLFQMLCDAGFGQEGDWTQQKVVFAKSILEMKHDATQVQFTYVHA